MTDQLIAGKLLHALRELPEAYARLRWFVEPGSRPTDTGSRQRHGDSVRDPAVLTVLDLLDDREKGTPVRDPAEVEADEVWDAEKDEWVKARRKGVLPTLSGWCRLLDGKLWDSGIEHVEYGLTPCTANCETAPVAARAEHREGPCSDDPQRHWAKPVVATECAWLTARCEENPDWLIEQDWLDTITNDLTDLLSEVQLFTGTLPVKKAKWVCLNPGCGWPLAEQDGGAWFTCTGCKGSWSRVEMHHRAERKAPKPLREVAVIVGVSERTLRTKLAEGKFKPCERRGAADLFTADEVSKAMLPDTYSRRGKHGRIAS